jgi:two-component system OmpR family sensor kinase
LSSLRRGLTTWLCAAVAGVGVICVAVGYWQSHKETQSQLDYQMEQVARILAAQDFSAQRQPDSPEGPQMLPKVHIQHDNEDDLIVVVRDASGRLLYVSKSNRHIPGGLLPPDDALGFQIRDFGNGEYRVFSGESNGLRIEIAQSMDVIREAEGAVALATLLPIVLLLPVLALVIGIVIRKQIKPLDDAAAALAHRPATSFEDLPVADLPAEVQPLVDEINRLMRRLDTTVTREKQFVTDAAHALRTPLTALQLQADVLDGGRDEQEKAARLAQLRAGIRRVIRLSEQLLSLARNEYAAGPVTDTTDLHRSLEDVSQLYGSAARAGDVQVCVESNAPVSVPGNARRIALIFANLVDNAIRYSQAGGSVHVRSAIIAGRARIEVWDEGVGLPPQELERVFERFYRAPGDESSGSGLGLSTVDSIVRQLGGSVWLENRADANGLIAIVTLPVVRQLASPDVDASRLDPAAAPGA